MRRILLVDDSAIAREPLAKLLAYEGYDVLAASNGLEAMETLRDHPIDLLLLDVIMPTMDGGDVAAHIKNDRLLKDVPIVFLTATVSRSEAGDVGLNSGGELFLAKPVSVESLIKCINDNTRKAPSKTEQPTA